MRTRDEGWGGIGWWRGGEGEVQIRISKEQGGRIEMCLPYLRYL